MQKFINLIVFSSANPDKASMTIKGFLLQYLALLIAGASLLGIPLLETQAVEYIEVIAGITGVALSIFGLSRKLYFSIKKLMSK